MAEIIQLDVYINDGTILNPSETKQFVVNSITDINTSVSGGDYAVGAVNAQVYYNTGFGIKAFYVSQTPAAIATLANA